MRTLLLLAACVQALSAGAFYETFDVADLHSAGWHVSSGLKDGRISYNGVWKIEEPHRYPGYKGDMGLVMTTEADFYSIFRPIAAVLSENRDLVFQYEVKFQDGIECGGAYFKLVAEAFPEDQFSDQIPYEIMFGPDICGSDNKVQFIYRKETHNGTVYSGLRTPPMARKTELLTLYTLIVRADLEAEIRINGETAKKGHLLNSPNFMAPPLSVPPLIPDAAVQKPADWDDRPVVLDLAAEKPLDWDATYGCETLPDPAAEKPAGWNDAAASLIPDPRASRPAEWLDAEDGPWTPPMLPNPACKDGCGEWKAPRIPNPEYKGKWRPPYIINPNYKGDWKPPMKENPEFSGISRVARPITGIGMEAWTMQSGVLFNNLYLGNSVADAEKIGNDTFLPKLELENESYKLTAPKPRHAPRAPPQTFEDLFQEPSFLGQLKESLLSTMGREIAHARLFWASFKALPNEAVAGDPFRFAIYCFSFVIAFVLVFGGVNVAMFLILFSREAQRAQEKKEKAKAEGETEKKEKKDGEAVKIVVVDTEEIAENELPDVGDAKKIAENDSSEVADSEAIVEAVGATGARANDTELEKRR